MSIALVGTAGGVAGTASGGSTDTLTYTSTAGNTLLFIASTTDTTGISLTDSAGNTWSLVHDNAADGGTSQKHLVAYACTGAKAITSVSWTAGTGTTNYAWCISEWTPATVTSSAGAVGSVPTVTGDLTVIAAGQYQAANYAENAGWTQLAYLNDGAHGGYALNVAYGGTGAPWADTGSFGYLAVGLTEATVAPTYTHYIRKAGVWVPATRTIL